MAYTLDANFPVPNPRRFEVDVQEVRTNIRDPTTVFELQVTLEFRSAPATNREYGTYVLAVRNGQSDQLRPANPYPAGNVLQDMLTVARSALATPTGMDQVLAAWRTGGTGGGANNRRDNTLAVLRTLQIISQTHQSPEGATLAGTVS